MVQFDILIPERKYTINYASHNYSSFDVKYHKSIILSSEINEKVKIFQHVRAENDKIIFNK